jgi:hypothetical protein
MRAWCTAQEVRLQKGKPEEEVKMSERWPPLGEFVGLAAGSLVVVSLAAGVILLAQNLGASGLSLIVIASVVFLLAGVVIGKALP